MQVLIGTTNPAKRQMFERVLDGYPVSFITLSDLGITAEPEEMGHTPAENAAVKAAFYGRFADYVICKEVSEDGYLRMYDDIIVGGRDLYDGKIIH